ncbi:MAG: hypothetical protein L0H22_08260, partial [Brevibacterium aurantiacum]|nr:hypothetical protein [Brevibacterium aurantiacum]
GPLARAYYFRQAKLSGDEQEERSLLFGRATEGLRPNRPYRWAGTGGMDSLLELPVTTMPFARVPIHLSYLIMAYQVNPTLAKVYERAALRLCRVTGTGPSILMHPLDLLDTRDAPGLEFFPAAAYPAEKKRDIARRFLNSFQEKFDVVGTGAHARHLQARDLPMRDPQSLAVPDGTD